MVAKRGKKKGRTISVDLSGVESGGGRAIPDGNYTLECTEAEEEESSSGNPMIVMKWKVTEGSASGARVYDNVSLQPQALWRLKTLLECIGGFDDLDAAIDLDLDDLVGKTVDAEITNETWEGKQRPKITGWLGAGGESGTETNPDDPDDKDDDDKDDDDKDDDKPARKTPGKKADAKAPKIKKGAKVKFKDEKGKTLKGIVTEISDEDAVVEVDGEEWDLSLEDLSLA